MQCQSKMSHTAQGDINYLAPHNQCTWENIFYLKHVYKLKATSLSNLYLACRHIMEGDFGSEFRFEGGVVGMIN